MKNIKILLVILTAALFFTACQKDEIPDLWNIRGTIEIHDAEIPDIKTPIGNIKVYLLDLESSIDTLTGWFKPENLLDSTITSASGSYSFNNIESHDYWIYPKDTLQQRKFSLTEESDSLWILSNSEKSDFEINFTTPELVAENDDDSFVFQFRVTKAADFSFERNSGTVYDPSKSKTNLVIRIKRKTRAFQGWGTSGLRVVQKWSDPYWSVVNTREIERGGFFKLYARKDASNLLYHYKDEFIINFSYEYSHSFKSPYGDIYWYSDGTEWMCSKTDITGNNFQHNDDYTVKLYTDKIEVIEYYY